MSQQKLEQEKIEDQLNSLEKENDEKVKDENQQDLTHQQQQKQQKQQQEQLDLDDLEEQDIPEDAFDKDQLIQQNSFHQIDDQINIMQNANDLDQIRAQFQQHYQILYQQPGGQNVVENMEGLLDQLSDELQSIDDKQSQISDNKTLLQELNNITISDAGGDLSYQSEKGDKTNNISNNSNKTGISIKPSKYIPRALKEKLDVLALNFHKELKVLSHQKLVFIWVAMRIHSQKHEKFWQVLMQSYSQHIIMRRYQNNNFLEQDLKTGKFDLNPIVLMISGFCGQTIIPKIYGKYRFKGIVVYTDKTGLKLNEGWVKKYPRVVILTSQEEEAQNMLHKLINNTLFRGACKFKDLDHFLGKKKPVSDYFLEKIVQDQVQQQQISQKDNINISEEVQEENDDEKQQQQKQNKNSIWQIKNEPQDKNISNKQALSFQNAKQISKKLINNISEVDQKDIDLQFGFKKNAKQQKKKYKNRCQQQNDWQEKNEQNSVWVQKCEKGPFIFENFDNINFSFMFHFSNLLDCKKIILSKKVLIRTDMLEEKSLKKMAELFEECFPKPTQQKQNQKEEQKEEVFNNDINNNIQQEQNNNNNENSAINQLSIVKQMDQYQIAVNLLIFYTRHETDFYALINCALNTLNEDLIMQLQIMIKSLRLAHTLYDDSIDTVFESGEIVNLWRGCTFDRDYFQSFFRKGEHIVFPAFTSTSTDVNSAKQYAVSGNEKRIIFKIECVCDDDMMQKRPKNLKSISKYPEESEYLMNCFSLLYISDIHDNWEGGYLLYSLKLLR